VQCSQNRWALQRLFGSSFFINGEAYFEREAVKITNSKNRDIHCKNLSVPGQIKT